MVREVYLQSAATAVRLLAHPVVAERWEMPSALAKLDVGPLAAHLASQLTQVPPVLTASAPGRPVALTEHFARSTWTDGDIDSPLNTGIRRAAERAAAAGPDAVAAEGAAALDELRRRLPAEPADRVIPLPWGPWALTLDDYLRTRLLELAVHCDDLAVSVDVAPPELPPAALDAVIGMLSEMAARRHGAFAVIRALSRAERAPRTIAAL